MEFNEFQPLFSVIRQIDPQTLKGLDAEQFYRQMQIIGKQYSTIEYNRLEMERGWVINKRPYYCVWPTIIPCLIKLSLDFDSGYIKTPMEVLNIRLPKKNNPMTFEFEGQEYQIKTIMLAEAVIRDERGLSTWIDIGEMESPHVPIPVYTFRNIQTKTGLTLEDSLKNLPVHFSANMGIIIPNKMVEDCIRLACTLCLLDQDASIIEPDVLAADRDKFEKTGDQKFVDKAKRRGKLGWHVGRNVEVSPHIRGPSPAALYWTGKGKTVPKIRFRAGCVVHRKVISNIPTGFMGDIE